MNWNWIDFIAALIVCAGPGIGLYLTGVWENKDWLWLFKSEK